MLVSALSVIPLIFLSVLIAMILRGLARPVTRLLPVAPRWSVIVVLILLFVASGLFFATFGPRILEQFDRLSEQVPQTLEQTRTSIEQYEWGQQIVNSLQQVPSDANNMDILSRLTGFFSGAFGAIANGLLVIVAGIYLAFEPSLYVNNLIRLFPLQYRERAHDVLREGHEVVQRWLVARLLSMVVVGVLTLIGLWIIDLPLALTLSVIAAVLSFIPNLGPFLAAAPAFLVGLAQSPLMALLVLVVYSVVQQIENYLITPNIQRKTVKLPPALVMLSQVFLLLIFGWLGLFIAAPLVAFCIVLVKSIYIEDFLGDELGRMIESDTA